MCKMSAIHVWWIGLLLRRPKFCLHGYRELGGEDENSSTIASIVISQLVDFQWWNLLQCVTTVDVGWVEVLGDLRVLVMWCETGHRQDKLWQISPQLVLRTANKDFPLTFLVDLGDICTHSITISILRHILGGFDLSVDGPNQFMSLSHLKIKLWNEPTSRVDQWYLGGSILVVRTLNDGS